MIFQTTRAAAAMLLVGALAACEGGMMSPFASREPVETYTPILTEADFRSQVVGRQVAYANGSVGSYGADGTWSIAEGERSLGSGTWTWQGEQWCRTGATFEGPVTAACESVAVSPTGIRFTREDGQSGELPFV